MRRILTIGLTLLLLSGCGDRAATDDPWGVTTVQLPGTVEEIAAVFNAMPPVVAGYPRGETDDEHLIGYGAAGGMSMWVQFGEHRIGSRGEELSPSEFLSVIADSKELNVIDSVLSGSVVWLHGSTSGEDGTEWIVMVGEADGEFLFCFDGFTETGLDALLQAFVEVAKA